MHPGIIAFVLTLMIPLFMMLFVRARVRGKMLCVFARKDKSLAFKFCALQRDFIIWGDRAYDVYPDLVRVVWWPTGWPGLLQVLVPAALYDEEDARPMDWIDLKGSEIDARERSMAIKGALEGNWIQRAAREEMVAAGGGTPINWRRIFPIALIVIGGLGLVSMLFVRGCPI